MRIKLARRSSNGAKSMVENRCDDGFATRLRNTGACETSAETFAVNATAIRPRVRLWCVGVTYRSKENSTCN